MPYDLENRQPDIVYIHNPYDGINKLTMVYPKYFSKNLLNYTNMLVYVPYFVAGSYENQVSQFNLLPGAVNSTKVVVQSKVQKELFIASGHSCDNILNLGSPKFDATLLACRNNKTIRPEWKNIIKDKKVFLFNTGISDLLSNLD
ncbi:hypothetical protein CHF27_002455 [Romboutsia maritimum]|uniref:Uncharacterized protein n=1 Tax=Romboutsia maritimum TaxID=2020948 RepID=A0A371IVM7_9FIRM|nr:hypothetical protein [Romboutsia maritimum]RDY24521.1 hypothetical protein CHF27_002455 [Romboutsia maritimum]